MMEVLYWNIYNRRPPLELALRDNYNIIAIQEPSREGRLYCPRAGNYHAVYNGGRAALYINKRYAIDSWESRAEKDWYSITLKGSSGNEGDLIVYSVYSPGLETEGANWASPIYEFLREAPPQGQRVLVGDFNLYHPLWDRKGRTIRGSEDLLELAERWHLELITLWGEVTWSQHGKESLILDHAWASRDLDVRYKGDPGYTGSDHTAQVIRITRGAPATHRQAAPEGWCWKKMDRGVVNESARHLRITIDLGSPEALDRAVDSLIEQLQEIANRSTPKRKPITGCTIEWWDKQVSKAVAEVRRACRRYAAERSDRTWDALKEAEKI